MKIQASNASQIYKSFASAPKTVKGGKPEAAKSAVSNMDKIELSGTFCMGNCMGGVCVKIDGEQFSLNPESTDEFFNDKVLPHFKN